MLEKVLKGDILKLMFGGAMRFLLFACLLPLAGCAADTIRLERAGAVSTQAKATVSAAQAYVADVRERRREGAVALVASDPSCLWGPSIEVDRDWKGDTALCDVSRVPPGRRQTINLTLGSPEAIRAITTAVAGLAAYQAALADVLEDDPDEARDSAATAIETLSTAAGDFNRIAGSKAIDLGPLTSARSDAVVKLVGTLVTLQQTSLKVGGVRRVAASTDAVELIDALNAGVTRLGSLQDGNSAVLRLAGLTTAYSMDARKLPFTERVIRVREIAAASDDVAAGTASRVAVLKSVLDKMRIADAALRDALSGRFSAEERRRIARENRKQLFSLLSQVAAIFPPL